MSPSASTPRRGFLRPPLAAALLCFLGACEPEDAVPPPPPLTVQPAPAAPAPEAAPPPVPAGTGSFRVAYTPPRDGRLSQWERFARSTRFLEGTATDLNGWLALPTPVTLSFAGCGEANAFYDGPTRRVMMCWELLDALGQVFGEPGPPEERERAILGAASFLLYHELGHALIDVLDLPALGREEDSADQFAAYVLVDGTEDGERAAMDGAVALGRFDAEFGDMAFADEHSLGVQRFYNVACWVYGRDPERHARFLEAGTLPGERAERCPGEYDALVRAGTACWRPTSGSSAPAAQRPPRLRSRTSSSTGRRVPARALARRTKSAVTPWSRRRTSCADGKAAVAQLPQLPDEAGAHPVVPHPHQLLQLHAAVAQPLHLLHEAGAHAVVAQPHQLLRVQAAVAERAHLPDELRAHPVVAQAHQPLRGLAADPRRRQLPHVARRDAVVAHADRARPGCPRGSPARPSRARSPAPAPCWPARTSSATVGRA